MQAEVRNPRWRLTNGNTHISACTQRSFTILKAISMFWRSRNPMKLFPFLCELFPFLCKQKSEIQDGGLQKRKYSFLSLYTTYASESPLAKQLHTNLTVFIISAQFWQLNTYTEGTGVQWSYSLYCLMQTEIINTKMAAYTQKILTSQIVYNVTANFQWLKYVSKVQDLNNAVLYIV